MKRILSLAGLLAFAAAPALAADLPAKGPVYTKAPAYVAAAYNWTGPYIGVHLGGAWASWSTDTSVAGVLVASDSGTLSGIIGGAQLGYNWQVNNLVWGLETDISASGQRRSATSGAVTFSESIPWFGTTRVRLGVLANNWLWYGTAGVAYTGLRSTVTAVGVTDTSSTTRIGWTAGAGVEVPVATQWTAKLEYLYIDAARSTTTTGTVSDSFRARNNVLRVGVNYRF
jgi:outer membrane immunogenic protein